MKIAIDGHSASGKSTIGQGVAEVLKLPFFSTGILYRVVALYVLDKAPIPEEAAQPEGEAISPTQVARFMAEAAKAADDIQSTISKYEDDPRLRTSKASAIASLVSQDSSLRSKLNTFQHNLANTPGGIVMDGRDITTNIMPNAPHRFFITATAEERARRRLWQHLNISTKQQAASHAEYDSLFAKLYAAITKRDKDDSNRAHGRLFIAEGVTVVDTTKLTAQQSIELILSKVQPPPA